MAAHEFLLGFVYIQASASQTGCAHAAVDRPKLSKAVLGNKVGLLLIKASPSIDSCASYNIHLSASVHACL